MNIDWAALATVFGVSLVVTVALVGLFSLGIVSLARQASAERGGGSPIPARVGAYACFALCTAAVAYGIYLIVA
ncbi:hypothetical protein [Streptomyces sp. NRRL WC-3549]|uniref:hypothetical protein n=1 Tax=Streptomyces sp. NRRL WC-3549 TaxID=1463925 RepID=UPI0004C9EC24|nr:hypothetical protein [Streptomyces sp. NRRL WC-3549]